MPHYESLYILYVSFTILHSSSTLSFTIMQLNSTDIYFIAILLPWLHQKFGERMKQNKSVKVNFSKESINHRLEQYCWKLSEEMQISS